MLNNYKAWKSFAVAVVICFNATVAIALMISLDCYHLNHKYATSFLVLL